MKKITRDTYLAITFFIMGFILIGSTFYLFVKTLEKEIAKKEMDLSSIHVSYIDFTKLYLTKPYSLNEGLQTKPYQIKIKNKTVKEQPYYIKIVPSPNSDIDIKAIKVSYLTRENKRVTRALNDDLIILEDIIEDNEVVNWNFHIFIDKEVESSGHKFLAKIDVLERKQDGSSLDQESPVIILNGSSNYVLKKGQEFTDEGIKSINDDFTSNLTVTINYQYFSPLTNQVLDIKEIDTNLEGLFFIFYRSKDKKGNEAVAVRTINVTKNIPPTITLKGKEIVSIKKNSIYIDDGIVAVDFLGKDISKDVKCFSKVDLSNVGTYPLFYIVKDDNKTIGVETRLISVNDHKKTLLK